MTTDHRAEADRLREAAKVLRERAEATSWAPECGGWWRPDSQPRLPAQVAEADVSIAECHFPPNADYIATMHPGVALALADWLEATASTAAHIEDDLAAVAGKPSITQLVGYDFAEAFALADLILEVQP